jgi:hypothetical protein
MTKTAADAFSLSLFWYEKEKVETAPAAPTEVKEEESAQKIEMERGYS